MTWKRMAVTRPGGFQTRDADGNLYIEGYFATFEGVYEMWSGDIEKIDPHAFDETLNEDIRALVNHDSTLVLGRTSAGTLALRVDEHGLWGSILINPNDQDAVNLYERVKRGDVSQCSFGFDILDEKFENQGDGTVVFTLLRVKLYEVSCVTFPAYEDTAIKARQKDHEDIVNRRNQAWRETMLKKLKGE